MPSGSASHSEKESAVFLRGLHGTECSGPHCLVHLISYSSPQVLYLQYPGLLTVLKHAKYTLTTGLLHLLFSVLGTLFPHRRPKLTLQSPWGLSIQIPLMREALFDHQYKIAPSLPSIISFNLTYNIYRHLAYYIFLYLFVDSPHWNVSSMKWSDFLLLFILYS